MRLDHLVGRVWPVIEHRPAVEESLVLGQHGLGVTDEIGMRADGSTQRDGLIKGQVLSEVQILTTGGSDDGRACVFTLPT